MKIITLIKLLHQAFIAKDKEERNSARFVILERLASLLSPKFIHTDQSKIWIEEQEFLDYYENFHGKSYRSADRKYFLKSLLSLIEYLPGDTAECGVYYGATSYLICEKFKEHEPPKLHHAFDSFEGLSHPLDVDGNYWHEGDLNALEDVVRDKLAPYRDRVIIYKGWIPKRFEEIYAHKFCFVHIDVDLYEPTLDSLKFFYPRLVKGGIILSDDYGFSTCPGAKKAFDEYMEDKPEKIVHVPTGQAFILKIHTIDNSDTLKTINI